MPKNYTVAYNHPSGASATFTYENGEMSALARGLDAEQFWTFKQVKAYLLRNDDDDLTIASQMMAKLGFTAHMMQPLPGLLASEPVARSSALASTEDESIIRYRRLPGFDVGTSKVNTVSEIHWREGDNLPPPPPRTPLAREVSQSVAESTPIVQWNPTGKKPQTVSEIHWREGDAGQEGT